MSNNPPTFLSFLNSACGRSLLCLLIAIVLYGAVGTPTPTRFGLAEAVIGALLICAVGTAGVSALFSIKQGEAWVVAGRAALFSGLSIPLLGGVFHGHEPWLIVRDMLAFAFIMLPVFLYPMLKARPEGLRLILGAALICAGLFSIRYLMGSDPLDYLSNSPLILMGAIYVGGMALQVFVARFSLRCLLPVCVLAGFSALCLLPLLETQQRASAGLFAVAMAGVIGLKVWEKPVRMLPVIALLIGAGVYYWPDIAQVIGDFQDKTALVGLNSRAEEWRAVWASIADHPLSLLFGKGWGAGFASPAVADIKVHYTHSLLSFMILKSGLTGAALMAVYIACLLRAALRQWQAQSVICVALLMPVLIDTFLYAAYKSLDFGILLTLCASMAGQRAFLRGQKAHGD